MVELSDFQKLEKIGEGRILLSIFNVGFAREKTLLNIV